MGTTWFRRDRRELDQQVGDERSLVKKSFKNTNADYGYALAA